MGPGAVDLLTGNFSTSSGDVSIDAPISDLTFTRTYNSRAGGTGILGPGWSGSVGVQSAQSDYVRLVDAPGSSVQITETDGMKLSFAYRASGLVAELEARGLTLTASSDSDLTKKTFTLTDLDGNVTTFTYAGVPSQYVPTKVAPPATSSQTTTRYTWDLGPDGAPRVTRVLAPVPAGVNCDGALVAGCRALTLAYATATTASGSAEGSWGTYAGRLERIDYTAYDPDGSQMRTVAVEQYAYDDAGRLRAAWDPRIVPALKTTYDYDADGKLRTITPPGLAPWTLSYVSGAAPGTVQSASRPADPGPGTATTSVVYGVPLTGSSAPFQMGPGDVSAWAQDVPPTDATAIFQPGDAPSTDPAALRDTDVYYFDARDRQANLSAAGGRISTTEHDKFGNVVRELTPENRKRSLAAADPVATAKLLDTQRTYGSDGTELKRELGPQEGLGRPHSIDGPVATLTGDSPRGTGLGTMTLTTEGGGYVGTVECAMSEFQTSFDVAANASGALTTARYDDGKPTSACSASGPYFTTAKVASPGLPYQARSASVTGQPYDGTLTVEAPRIQVVQAGGMITCVYGKATGDDVIGQVYRAGNANRPSGATEMTVVDINATLDVLSGSNCGTGATWDATYQVPPRSGAETLARPERSYRYDEGAPAGGPYHLVTTKTVGALLPGTSSAVDLRTTAYGYSDDANAGWLLRAPTRTTVDPTGLALITRTVYDPATGLLLERRLPSYPDGVDGTTTKSTYYSASSGGACGNRPEWGNLLCTRVPDRSSGVRRCRSEHTGMAGSGYLRSRRTPRPNGPAPRSPSSHVRQRTDTTMLGA